MPEGDTLFRTAAGLRPYLVGREVIAARTQGPGPVPQVHRIIGKRIAGLKKQLEKVKKKPWLSGSAGR